MATETQVYQNARHKGVDRSNYKTFCFTQTTFPVRLSSKSTPHLLLFITGIEIREEMSNKKSQNI